MLEKITLVIPTHNRHSYLQRILNYYKGLNLKILVADSTKTSYPQKENFNIDYYHCPGCYYSEKLNNTFQKVKTPYIFICADDDFIIPSAVYKCIDFLEKHNDYYSAQGQYLRFGTKIGTLSFWSSYKFLLNVEYDVNAETPEKRMRQLMTLYMHNFYSVHRIEDLRDSNKILEKFKGNLKYSLFELFYALFSIINGKHKIFPFLYCAREKHPYLSDEQNLREHFRDVIKNPKMKEHYEFFINSLSDYLANRHNYTLEDSKRYVLKALNYYLKFNLPNQEKFTKENKRLINYLNIKKKIFSGIVKNNFPRIYNKISSKYSYQRFENPTLNNYSEIIKIRDHILRYPV